MHLRKGLVAAAFAVASTMAMAEITWWSVPAMSGERRMPDADPQDGEKGGEVRIVMAQEEFEPGSFVVMSDVDLGKTRFVMEPLKNEKRGPFQEGSVDIKVVKVWYQCENAWWSYFGDNGNVLCPELLLHDEDLIRVDTAKKANYAKLVYVNPKNRRDVKVKEQWLNMPRKLDKGFASMRPEFHDAKALQPVSLDKGVRKQFVITVHATRWTAPGVYRAKIKLLQGLAPEKGKKDVVLAQIPVAVRVMDFALPPPKAYFHPEMDFLTCSYNYSSIEHIMGLNGGDAELGWKQMEVMLRDLAEHGQMMHWLRGGVGGGTDRTLDLMQKVGLRTDVLVGGALSWDWGRAGNNTVTNLTAWAKRQADYYDRKVGHHNIYIGRGDEPGCGWFVTDRWAFDIFQRAGFNFIIASQNGIFSKVGYDWGWHNASKDPCEDNNAPVLWNQVGTRTHCAWYSNQHVGPENPDFNRRQYGLGAYLGGYSATCNYAHHFGPYNDDGDYYKPMVFAYGSGDGVIDTIQWEGYREGVDDIRYATEMCRLARTAIAKGDFDTARLGRRALMYLAKVDRAKDALDTIRNEMTVYILKLRLALGKDVPAPVYFQKNEKFVFGSLAQHPRGEREPGGHLWEWQREPVEQAIAKMLDKPRNPVQAKRDAANKLIQLDHHPLGPAPLTRGVWSEAYADYKRIKTWTVGDTNYVLDVRFLIPYAKACAQMGDVKEAKVLYNRVLESKAKGISDAMRFTAAARMALLDTPEEIAAVSAACKKAYDAYGKKLDKKALAAEVEGLAKHVGGPGHELAVRGVMAFRDTVFAKRAPKKVCAVRYSKEPISGIAGFAAVERLSDVQKMDRPFGGNTDMLATDVTTGDRGAISAGGIDPAKAPRLDVLCDDWGVHVRFVIQEPDARKIETGLVRGPSIEGYIAPGDDAPYICNFSSLRPGGLGFFNTAYDGRGHRRLRTTNVTRYKQDVVYSDNTVKLYFALSWDNYPTRIPKNGSIWNFEQILWGGTSYTWNGVENIHGRSTWGQLKFELPDAARASILRKRLCKAAAAYGQEKRSYEMHEGVIDHWSDAVIGDVAFFEKDVKPVVTVLDQVVKQIKPDMDDKTTLELADKYLEMFEDLRPNIELSRAAYLMHELITK